MIRAYLNLVKPGIVRGNALVAAAGFLLASKGDVDFGLLVLMLAGISLVIASACVFNNYIDRDIDAHMNRTKNRALASGLISTRSALAYGSILGAVGFFILILGVNWLSALVAAIGFFFYVVLYSLWKRRSSFGTVVGSVAGAVPPVVGYTTVNAQIDWAAILLFLILVLWQMPHFYSISIFRLDDYRAAGLPVLPAVNGKKLTKKYIYSYILAFIVAVSALSFTGTTGFIYLIIVLAAALAWLQLARLGFSTKNDTKWARQLFRVSLIVLLTFSLMISIDYWLP